MITDGMVDRAAQELTLAAEACADAINHCARLEDERAAIKADAILSLMQQTNPLTSTADKPKLHSASSAEAVVETDENYAEHRARQRAAEVVRLRADAAYHAAKARLWLAVDATKRDHAEYLLNQQIRASLGKTTDVDFGGRAHV